MLADMRPLAVFILLCSAIPALGQSFMPPYCFGNGKALQYSPQGWVCANLPAGPPGPAGPAGPTGATGPAGPAGPPGASVPAQPPPTECITSHWDGTKWACVPTNYLEAR